MRLNNKAEYRFQQTILSTNIDTSDAQFYSELYYFDTVCKYFAKSLKFSPKSPLEPREDNNYGEMTVKR